VQPVFLTAARYSSGMKGATIDLNCSPMEAERCKTPWEMNLEYLLWSIGALSRPSWTRCGFERRLTQEKATRLQPPAGGFPWWR